MNATVHPAIAHWLRVTGNIGTVAAGPPATAPEPPDGDRPPPGGYGGQRVSGLNFVQPSIEHGRRTVLIPDGLEKDEFGDPIYFGTGLFQIWPLACRALYFQVQPAPTVGPANALIYDLSGDDPAPQNGQPPLILIPGIPVGGVGYFSEPTVELHPPGFPFDRGCRIYVGDATVYDDTFTPQLAKVTARMKVEKCPCSLCAEHRYQRE